jgi:hypothetical protein
VPERDELHRFLYKSRDLACAASYETTSFLSNERQFNPNCWYAFTFMGCGFVGISSAEGLINLLTDQRGKPFQGRFWYVACWDIFNIVNTKGQIIGILKYSMIDQNDNDNSNNNNNKNFISRGYFLHYLQLIRILPNGPLSSLFIRPGQTW